MKKIRAALFDLDGTLVDSLADLAAAGNRVLTKLGKPVHEQSAYRNFVGNGVRHLMRKALLPETDEALVEHAAQLMREDYARSCNELSQAYPGMEQLMADLRAAGLKLAVVTNKPDEIAGSFVDGFFTPGTFDRVVGEIRGRPRKPDPAPALAAAMELGVDPGQCVFVGDSDVDMKTGSGAGMPTVGVLWGYQDRERLESSSAGVIVSTAEEAKQVILEMAGHERS
ncbi:MAG: phosphoglycolate phosphatase [Desulfovibrionales bacterium]|jgi:phosphoglycolate phosphatase|nr:phosphoglycolate phosphatase [Desulfovibrionales bacterium]